MHKHILSFALAASLGTQSHAEHWSIVVPNTIPGGGMVVKEELWSFFVHTPGPSDLIMVLNGTDPGQIASLRIPSDKKYAQAKWRARTFAREMAAISQFIDGVSGGAIDTDIIRTLRYVALNRFDDTPINLLLLTSAVQTFPVEPSFSMRSGDVLRVPSPGHLIAPVTETPFGMGNEGAEGLSDVYVHLCNVNDDLSSDTEAIYQSLWGTYIAARNGVLVTWSDDLATCFERFASQARRQIGFVHYVDDGGVLEMRDINRNQVTVIEEPTTTIVNGIEVEQFNIFSSSPHPTLPSREVTTGVIYVPGKYPDVYERAYCYFNVLKSGTSIRFDLGVKPYGQNVAWDTPSTSSLRSAGITRRDFESGKPACSWPQP